MSLNKYGPFGAAPLRRADTRPGCATVRVSVDLREANGA
jgi:hypothetical protein